jgi:hypothetical protein
MCLAYAVTDVAQALLPAAPRLISALRKRATRTPYRPATIRSREKIADRLLTRAVPNEMRNRDREGAARPAISSRLLRERLPRILCQSY